jgi:hypothetical protein
LVALNFSGQERTFDVRDWESGTILVSTHLDREGPIQLARVRLRADEGCIIQLHRSG